MSSRWLVTLTGVGLVICLLLGPAAFLSAQETKEPGTPPQPRTSPQIPPVIPGAGMSMPLPQLLGALGGLKKSDAQASPAALYPMFQILGPMMPTASNPADPAMMGTLLRLQGELMIKMGEVMMKYGQMMLEKDKPEVGSRH